MFMFNYNTMANVTRKAAGALLAVGLLLVGLGVLVILLKAVFIIIVAGLIFLAAMWCITTAIRMFIRLYGKPRYPEDDFVYRENVRIHNGNNDGEL